MTADSHPKHCSPCYCRLSTVPTYSQYDRLLLLSFSLGWGKGRGNGEKPRLQARHVLQRHPAQEGGAARGRGNSQRRPDARTLYAQLLPRLLPHLLSASRPRLYSGASRPVSGCSFLLHQVSFRLCASVCCKLIKGLVAICRSFLRLFFFQMIHYRTSHHTIFFTWWGRRFMGGAAVVLHGSHHIVVVRLRQVMFYHGIGGLKVTVSSGSFWPFSLTGTWTCAPHIRGSSSSFRYLNGSQPTYPRQLII